jgi:uncharacterized protein (DUF983 family)
MSDNQNQQDKALYPPVNPLKVGPAGKCPRCATGRLFKGYITPAKACSNCGLDYSFADSANGTDSLVILLVSFIVMGLALYTEVNFDPPLWLHFLIWIPLVIILTLVVLRAAKGILIAMHYQNRQTSNPSDKK